MMTAQFETREYEMRDGLMRRDLVLQLTRCIGIRRTDQTKARSWYEIIDIDSGMTFGCDVRTRKDAARVAGLLQAIVDDFSTVRGIDAAIHDDACRHRLRAVCMENRNKHDRG